MTIRKKINILIDMTIFSKFLYFYKLYDKIVFEKFRKTFCINYKNDSPILRMISKAVRARLLSSYDF